MFIWRQCPTLPHPLECSTIGAGGLSFRVRNGTGRFPTAIATAKNMGSHQHVMLIFLECHKRGDPELYSRCEQFVKMFCKKSAH